MEILQICSKIVLRQETQKPKTTIRWTAKNDNCKKQFLPWLFVKVALCKTALVSVVVFVKTFNLFRFQRGLPFTLTCSGTVVRINCPPLGNSKPLNDNLVTRLETTNFADKYSKVHYFPIKTLIQHCSI